MGGRGMRKSRRDQTEFVCFVRNHTAHPIRLTVPFGEMERRPQISADEYTALTERNRSRHAGDGAAAAAVQPSGSVVASGLGPTLDSLRHGRNAWERGGKGGYHLSDLIH